MRDASDDLVVDVSRDGGTTVVVAHGEVDAATSDHLERALAALAVDGGDGEVVVELGAVTFMDSSGLRALLTGKRAVEDAGLSLRVGTASAPVRRVLEIAGLAAVLRLPGP